MLSSYIINTYILSRMNIRVSLRRTYFWLYLKDRQEIQDKQLDNGRACKASRALVWAVAEVHVIWSRNSPFPVTWSTIAESFLLPQIMVSVAVPSTWVIKVRARQVCGGYHDWENGAFAEYCAVLKCRLFIHISCNIDCRCSISILSFRGGLRLTCGGRVVSVGLLAETVQLRELSKVVSRICTSVWS